MSASWAAPGVKCVCVDNSDTKLEAGCVYTISSINRLSSAVFFRLVGDKPDDGYFDWRFRPLTTRTQSEDVALFRKLLVPEGADA